MVKYSVVIPVHNEELNVEELFFKTKKVFEELKQPYEILFIEDGSTDKTFDMLAKLKTKEHKELKVMKMKKNVGQTKALSTGFNAAKGEIIITMDGDLQNDPQDIPLLLKKLEEEKYDVVSGWRYARKDPLFSKKVPSLLANFLRRLITKDKTHDAGCALKAYRSKCIKDLDLYGEMHRYLNTIMIWQKYKVGEVKVKHYPRKKGKTKYDSGRIMRGFLDLWTLLFWHKYYTAPQHFFGKFGLYSIGISVLIVLYHILIGFLYLGKRITVGPFLLLSVLLFIVGIILICFGFIGELQMRIYHKVKQEDLVEKII